MKELVEHGVVQRTVVDVVVKHTEYSLTDLGRSLIPVIEQICIWGDGFRPRLEELLKENSNS